MENSLGHIKRLQYLIDQVSRVRHMLDLNATVLSILVRTSENVDQDIPPVPSVTVHCDTFTVEFLKVWEETHILLKAASSLLARAKSISQHVGLLTSRLVVRMLETDQANALPNSSFETQLLCATTSS